MNLELFHDASQTPFEEEGVADDIREKTIGDLGIDEVDISHLINTAHGLVAIKGRIRGKTRDEKLKTAVWSAMQQDPRYAMEGPDQLVVFKAAMAALGVELAKPTAPQTEPAVEEKPAEPIDTSGSQRKKYVDDFLSHAADSNPH